MDLQEAQVDLLLSLFVFALLFLGHRALVEVLLAVFAVKEAGNYGVAVVFGVHWAFLLDVDFVPQLVSAFVAQISLRP